MAPHSRWQNYNTGRDERWLQVMLVAGLVLGALFALGVIALMFAGAWALFTGGC